MNAALCPLQGFPTTQAMIGVRESFLGTHGIILHTSGCIKYFIISEIFIRDFFNI